MYKRSCTEEEIWTLPPTWSFESIFYVSQSSKNIWPACEWASLMFKVKSYNRFFWGGCFGCFAWQNVLKPAVTAPAQPESLLRLASFWWKTLLFLPLLPPPPPPCCLPHPPRCEAADHLKRKGEGTWIKTEDSSLRYVSWCSSDL